MQKIKTWVLLADSAHALIYENEGPGKGLNKIREMSSEAPLKRDREIGTDRPGRTDDRAGQGRHAMEPPTSPHRHEAEVFCREVVEALTQAANRHKFDRLVIAAPPKVLGDVRRLLPKPLADKVTGELPKNLTKTPEGELPDHLGEVMVP